MNRQSPEYSARVLDRIDRVAAAQWDACLADESGYVENPFVSHAFLDALEQSRSVGRGTGWLPQHLVIEDGSGNLAAAAPLYVKSHSQGEYVFDHAWADAYERAGGRYYPKLQVAAPFSPVPGPRLLVRAGPFAAQARAALIAALLSAVENSGMSSLHVTFARRRMSPRWSRSASCAAPGCNTTGGTPATVISTSFSGRSTPASARRSARSAPPPLRTAWNCVRGKGPN